MLIQFTEEQKMLQDMAREFAVNEIAPRDRWMDENGFDFALYKKIAENGYMGINIPEEYGGSGGTAIDTCIILNEFARASASEAAFLDAHWMAADLVLYHGTEAQKQEYLPQASEGKIFAFGLTEAAAGSDAAGIKSTAKKREDGTWVLNGSKAWITNSGVADYYIILAMTDATQGARGISAFIVPKNAEGLKIGKFEKKMGIRGSATCELAFDNIVLPSDALLGAEGQGFKMAMEALDGGRISVGVICAGIAEHAMQIAKNYANERVAFGKPISKFQGLSFRFADMATDIEAMKLLTYNAASMKADGKRCTIEAAQTKLFASSRCTQICMDAQQVLGGNGYSKEYDIERLVRDARIWSIVEGTSEILRMVISSNILASK